MDISAFSEEHFDAKDWINKTFKSSGTHDNKEAFVGSLVMKLQLYVQQMNAAIEDTSQQVLSSLPRIVRDTQGLQMEVQTLKSKMAAIHEEIDKVQMESGQCMSGLEELDHLKTQLQSAKQSLLEADNWTTLITDIEELFERGDVNTVAHRLQAMNKSLQAMEKHVDASEKAAQLDGLRNRLEALASPQLVQAFTTANIEQSKQLVAIFTSMERLPQLLAYYKTCQKAALSQKWRELTVEDLVGVNYLQEFNDHLLQHWKEQMKYTTAILPPGAPTNVLASILTELYPALDPTQGAALQSVLKVNNDKLTVLNDAVLCTKKFANGLGGIIVNQDNDLYTTLQTLAQAVFAYLVPFVSQYPSFESTKLSFLLSSLPLAQPDPADTIQNVSMANSKVIQATDQAVDRCDRITTGCSYPGLTRVIEACLINYCDQYRMAVRQLERCKTYEQDWNTFQMCISLLQSMGDLYTQTVSLDSQIVARTNDCNRLLQNANPFQQYKTLLLTKDDSKLFESFIRNIHQASDAGSEGFLFEAFYGKLSQLCTDLHKVMFDNVCASILVQIEGVVSAPAWSHRNQMKLAPDLPEYSYTPQEYITQIGQYLMTLPQHLEPFLLQPNANLSTVLKLCDSEYKNNMAADVLLMQVSRNTCAAFLEAVLRICQLDSNACKQLAVDIEYLTSVLDELGLGNSLGDLSELPPLLRCSPENYHSQNSTNPRLVTAIRQMRGITSTA